MTGARLVTVTRAYEAWNRKDFEGSVTDFTDDVEWHPHIGAVDSRLFRGPEEIAAMFKDISEHFDLEMNFTRMEEIGDFVLVDVSAQGRGVESGASAEDSWFQVYRFRGDQVCRIDAFDSREEAIAAAERPGD